MLPLEWQPQISFPLILGTNVSGVITAVADDVRGFSVGDAVYSMIRFPNGAAGRSQAYAEYVSVPVSDIALKPSGIDHAHVAASPMSLLTAWQFLIDVGHDVLTPLQRYPHVPVPLAGRTVLVKGASGGVGHFAVQTTKLKRAHVIAVASGKHESALRGLGAEDFIDDTRTAPEDIVRDVDLVVDAVGGPATGRFLHTIKRGGALFPVFALGFTGIEGAEQSGVTVSSVQVRSNGTQLAEFAKLLSAGDIRVLVDSTYPLAEARRARERAALGHVQGKVVLTAKHEYS